MDIRHILKLLQHSQVGCIGSQNMKLFFTKALNPHAYIHASRRMRESPYRDKIYTDICQAEKIIFCNPPRNFNYSATTD